MFQDFLSGKWVLQIFMQNIKIGSYSERDWSQKHVVNRGFVFCKWRLQVVSTNQTSCCHATSVKLCQSVCMFMLLIIVNAIDV